MQIHPLCASFLKVDLSHEYFTMCLLIESHCTKYDRRNSNLKNDSFRMTYVWYRRGMRLLMIIVGLIAWFGTQALLGVRPDPGNKIDDVLHKWTTAANAFLHENPHWNTTLLIGSSVIVDFSDVFLLESSLFCPTLRPFLTLLILFLTRQICQALITLPSSEGVIWYHPSFPSLLVGKLLDMLLIVLEISAIIVLSAHYTMDIFAGVITALLASVVANWAVNTNESNKNLIAVKEKKTKPF